MQSTTSSTWPMSSYSIDWLSVDTGNILDTVTACMYDQILIKENCNICILVCHCSGTAGNAISFNKHFNHDQKFFSTPDRDNDMYPSGNCGAYYSSGWWFDACMSANLNGKYYHKRYKGVRNGIFWGTWHNMSTEYYPTNYRQAFKTVKMMIRPKKYAP